MRYRSAVLRAPRHARPLLLLAPALLLGWGCSSAPAPKVEFFVPGTPIVAAEFPGADRMLHGFGPASESTAWERGDEVLFGLRLCTGSSSQRWLLHVVVEEPVAMRRAETGAATAEPLPPVEWPIKVNGTTEPFRSPLCRVHVTVADGEGKVLGSTHPLVPRSFLQRGFAPVCRHVQRVLDRWPGIGQSKRFYELVEAKDLAEAVVSSIALLQVVQGDPVLSPLLWQIVQKPSVLSMLKNLGADVVIQPMFHATQRTGSLQEFGYEGSVWTVPMRLLVNDELALLTDLVVGAAAAPLHTCGGILGVHARHPRDATREFAMLLLAARSGELPVPSAPR